jgi:monothiol glutaredoxin
MLPDISGDEVETYLMANNLVQANDRAADAPTNQPCAHELPQPAPLSFRP